MASLFDLHDDGVPQYKLISGSVKSLGLKPMKNEANQKIKSADGHVRLPRASRRGTTKACKVQVKPAVDTRANRTVFVGNIPATCTKKHISQLFKPHGSIQSIRLRSIKVAPGDMSIQHAKKVQKQLVEGSTFNAYVVMASDANAEESLCLNGTLLQGRHLRVDLVERGENTQRSVFVGNLPFSVDEEKLRDTFCVCGEVESVRIVRDLKSGIGKGFGFVMFVDRGGVMFALKQNKRAILDGRTLRVYKCKDQQSLTDEKQVVLSGIRYNDAKAHNSKCKRPTDKVKKQHRDLGVGVPTDSNPQSASTKKFGKRRPDGTKNRYYRLPVAA